LAFVLVLGLVVLRSSTASFTTATANAGNTWSARSIILADDDAGEALFNVVEMWPGDAHATCITVRYRGGRDGAVALFAKISGGHGLERYLDLVVEQSPLGGGCDAVGGPPLFEGRLSDFAALHGGFDTGAGTWVADGGGDEEIRSYRFAVTLSDDNRAQRLTTIVSFTWQADTI
jgi:hypothetical protein